MPALLGRDNLRRAASGMLLDGAVVAALWLAMVVSGPVPGGWAIFVVVSAACYSRAYLLPSLWCTIGRRPRRGAILAFTGLAVAPLAVGLGLLAGFIWAMFGEALFKPLLPPGPFHWSGAVLAAATFPAGGAVAGLVAGAVAEAAAPDQPMPRLRDITTAGALVALLPVISQLPVPAPVQVALAAAGYAVSLLVPRLVPPRLIPQRSPAPPSPENSPIAQ